jgi:hypothetical protein
VEISSLSNERILALHSTVLVIYELVAVKVVRLSKSLALKGGCGVTPSEAQNMLFATEQLSLSAPKVYRNFTADIPNAFGEGLVKGCFIVMDYISGPTLEERWNSLDMSARQSVYDQVASMMETMQSQPLELPPGPIGANRDSNFQGPWFTEHGAGPFATLKELEDWCNHKIDVCIVVKQLQSKVKRFKFSELVFTHQDIASRNSILDAQGKVWLIDWELAGVYRPGFEHAIL